MSLSVGQIKRLKKTLTEDDVNVFSDITGDDNPLHLDSEYASESRFGKRICHGTLVEGLISACLNMFDGDIIYLSKQADFISPAYLGEELIISCRVVEELGGNRYKVKTLVYRPFLQDNKHDERDAVVAGTSTILVD